MLAYIHKYYIYMSLNHVITKAMGWARAVSTNSI